MFVTQRYILLLENNLCEFIGQIFEKSEDNQSKVKLCKEKGWILGLWTKKSDRVKHSFKDGFKNVSKLC